MGIHVNMYIFTAYHLLGVKSMEVDHAASHLGKAIGITTFIRSIPYNAQKRRVLIPQELLVKHGISQEHFIRYKDKEKVREVVYDIASQAHIHYKKVIEF
jgi:NADH dehydrogenase [ubiquinone] 1 alpha subcomplex assembly factor 6